MILNMIMERFNKKELPKLISMCFQIEKSLIKDHIQHVCIMKISHSSYL